jgi:CHASE2 domain-containing sensor protein
MSAHSGHPSFLKHFVTGCAVVLIAAVITHLLEDSWIFRHLENANLDIWLLAKKPVPSKDVFVVSITDDDYRNLFHATSPLQQDVVQQIVTAITAAGAKTIGVDLDTAEWDPGRAAALEALPGHVPVVWAREYSEDAEDGKLERVLGGAGEGVCYGLPSYTPDEDGVIRRYEPVLHTRNGRAEVSFARRIAGNCEEPKTPEGEAGGEEKLINFIGDRRAFDHLSSAALLTLSAVPGWSSGAQNPLRGKIVLLGGTFRAARDKFFTPVGRMDGVDILAHTVHSELPGGEVPRPGGLFFFVVDLLLGVALVSGVWFLPRGWALPAIFLGVPVLAFVASWATFQSVGYFASFVPVLGGVLLHEMIEHFHEHRHLLREHAHLIREHEALLREVKKTTEPRMNTDEHG